MGIGLLSLIGIGAAYFLWFLFVLALVSSLNEIKKTTWHYKLYEFPFGNRKLKNSCDYGKKLIAAPLLYVFIGLAFAVWILVVVIRFFFNWLIMPFFAGRIPEDGFSKIYFKKVIDPDTFPSSRKPGIYTKKFMRLSPFLWLVIFTFISAAVWEVYRVINGLATGLEINILLAICGVTFIVTTLIWTVKKPSLKIMYAMAKEKLCRNIPVVD